MNRFLEKRGECYALKSIAVQADIQEILRPLAGGISVPLFLKELRTALQIANCIALTPDTDNEPLYQKLDRYTNEWVTIDQKEFDKLYYEEPRRVVPRTYGPTLRKFFKGGGKFQLTVEPSGEKPAPEPTPETKKSTDQVNAVLESWAKSAQSLGFGGAQRVYGLVDKPKRDFGVELTPKRKAQDVRSDKYLEVCGRAPRKPDASGISITYVRSKNRLIPMFERVHAEPEPIKPEQLDPKACRQFVEQLLAFDELEAKREADIEQLLVTLLSHHEIGLLSYVHFFEGYSK